MQQLANKTAFITGGASGIGFAMARVFLEAGMKVVIADNSATNLADARQQLAGNDNALLLPLDVTDRQAFAAAADAAEARFGKIHLLCNNAGIGMSQLISKADYADWDLMMNINLGGVINGIVTMLPRIRRHGEGGHIVNTSSMAGILPLPDPGGIYTASKFAVRGLSDSLRLALVPDRIGVSTLFPGLTKSRILDPASQAREALAEGQELDPVSAAFVDAQRHAMDPLVLAAAVRDAVINNHAHIIAHGEFADEMQALHEELMASIRTDIPINPARAEFEGERRQDIEGIKARIEAW